MASFNPFSRRLAPMPRKYEKLFVELAEGLQRGPNNTQGPMDIDYESSVFNDDDLMDIDHDDDDVSDNDSESVFDDSDPMDIDYDSIYISNKTIDCNSSQYFNSSGVRKRIGEAPGSGMLPVEMDIDDWSLPTTNHNNNQRPCAGSGVPSAAKYQKKPRKNNSRIPHKTSHFNGVKKNSYKNKKNRRR